MTDATVVNSTEDPRVLRSRVAVLRAVVALLAEEGPSAITHQRVAERAGVGRATVYRHWPRPQDLVTEAIEMRGIRVLASSSGPLRARLREGVRELADEMRSPLMTAAVATMLEQALWDTSIRERRKELNERVVAEIQSALDQAVAEGELHGSPDPADFAAQILGPCMFRNLIQDGPVTDELIDAVIDAALAPWLA